MYNKVTPDHPSITCQSLANNSGPLGGPKLAIYKPRKKDNYGGNEKEKEKTTQARSGCVH
eukprot:247040-Pelagomonas_calceolata.AAC.2